MRLIALTLLAPALALAGCVEGGGAGTLGQPAAPAQICVGKAARLLKTPAADVSVVQALSYPEGEVITLAVTGKGRLRCMVDVDGKAGDLVWLDGGPSATPPPAAG